MNAREHEAKHLLQVYGQLPIEPESASGVYLNYGDRKIVDFYGGHAVACLGYGHPAMLKALDQQAKTVLFQSNAVAMEVRAAAADALADFAPGELNHVFFTNSGAESNENALRIACKLTGRNRIVAIEHGFHGRTAAAGAVTWGARKKWYGFRRRRSTWTFSRATTPARCRASSRTRRRPSFSNWCRGSAARTISTPVSSVRSRARARRWARC